MIINIIPINDLEIHLDNSLCNCSPLIEVLSNGDLLIKHNAYDDRS